MKKVSFTLLAIICMLQITNAQTYYWNGATTTGTGITPTGGTGTWSAAGTNWTTANPGNATAWSATKNADFLGTGATVTLGANQSATGIIFGVSNYVIAPGTGPYGITITGATPSITLGATLTNTINAPITTGSGTALTIIGTSSPVFTSGGNNNFGSTVALSSTAGSTNFTFSGNNTFTGLASIINTGGGTFNFSGSNTFSSGLTVSQTGGPKVNFTGSNTFSGPITISSTGSPTITFSGTGSNSFTGLTTINAASGTPAINYNAAVTNFSGGLTISEKSAISVGAINGMGPNGSAGTITVTSTASGTVLSNSGSVSNLNIVVYNPVVLNQGGTYTTNSYQTAMGGTSATNVTINWAGNISGGSDVFLGNAIGTGSSGQGFAILSGNNSWTGETVYNGKQTSNVLQCQSTTCFPPHTQFVYGSITAPVANGYGIVDLDGQNGVTIGSLESNISNAGLSYNWGFTNSSTSKATLIIQGGGTSNTNATFAGTIGIGTTGNGTTLTSTNNNIAITMSGSAGTETFSGVNGFTGGLNLNAGTLVMGVSNALAATLPVSFNGGALNAGGSNYTQGTSGAPLGALTVGSSGGSITLGSGNSLYFANSNSNLNSAYAWSGTLTITGWTGSNHIYVGNDNTGLYSSQLSNITYSGGSYNGQHAQILANGEVVPTGAAIVALGVMSPSVGTESPSTTFTVTANAIGATPANGSTVTFAITGIQSNQVVGGVLTGTITFNGSSTSATATFQTTTGTTFVGQETGSVALTGSTGSITTISTSPVTFTLNDNATFYWNGAAGTAGTAVAGPGLGGTGTWTTYTTPTNSWIIGQGASTTGNPGNWIDAIYPAYLGGSQGTIYLDGVNMTTPKLSPTTTTVATNNDVITPNNATAFTLGGNLAVGTTGSPVNVILNDPSAATSGTAATAARTLILTGGNMTGVTGSTITIGGQQGSSTSVYSWVELQPAVTGGSYATNVPVIINGTGGGYVDLSYNGGITGTFTLNGNGTNGAVQIANTNNAGVVLGSTAGYTLAVNGITASATNFSSVIISNKPSGTGSGNFIFEGTSNYYGPTTLAAAGTVKCATSNTLSPNSVYTFGPSGQGPTFDLNGTNQTIAGLASTGSAVGTITNSATSGNSAITINQGTGVTNTFGLPILNGAGSTVSLELSGVDNTSWLKLTSTGNTFTGGLKIDANGNLILGAANVVPASLSVNLNGGTLSTGGTTPNNTMNVLNVTTGTSAIAPEAVAHTLTFANMTGITAATPLTINNWNGTPGTTGTAGASSGKIIVSTALSATELNNINFTGYGSGSVQISGTGEIVPAQALLTATLDSISPVQGYELAGTVFTITATTTLLGVPTAVVNPSTVTFTLTGVQATQLVGGSLTGTITFAAGSSVGTGTFTVQNDNIYEGTETGSVAISNPAGNIGYAATSALSFTLVDDENTSLFYWNGGTPTNNPATGGTGTWTANNAFIAPVNDGSGSHVTWQPGNYNAYLVGPAANAGVITFQSSPNPTNIYIQATNYTFTTSTSPNNIEGIGGTINLPAGYNLNIFAPVTTLTSKELDIKALKSGAGATLTINQGAATSIKADQLDFDSAGTTISADINIVSQVTQSGGGAGSVAGIVGAAPNVTVTGAITNTSSQYAYTMLGVTSGNSMTISGPITSTPPITFSNGTSGGNGILTLTNTNNSFTTAYFNGTASLGLVQAGPAGSIPTSAIFVMGASSGNGQSFDLNGNDVTIASLSSTAGGTGTITNTAAGTGTNTLTVNQSVNTTFGLLITDGATSHTAFTKQGTGNLTFTDSSTYTGATTVSGGNLFINNATGLAAGSTVTVQGGTLAGNGKAAGTVNINNGGAIAPGGTTGAVANFTTGDENWATGSALNFDISNAAGGPAAQAGINWDLLTSTGTINLSSVGAGGITINISGTPTGFSASSGFSWQFATAAAINGFAANKFAFNVTNFDGGAEAAGNFSVTQSGSALILNFAPTVGTPTPITISAGFEPVCPISNTTTTTTYATTAANSTGFNWSLSNNAAGSIDPVTGVMTWANGFSGTVDIQVTANGGNGPSAQVTRTVTVGPALTTPGISANDPACNGGNGTITVSTPSTGGSGNPIEYSLNGGTAQTSTTFSNITPGTSGTVVATDVNGCTSATSNAVTVNQPASLSTPAIIETDPSCYGGTGTVVLRVPSFGGTGTIQYSLNGGTPQTSGTFSGVTAGTSCTVVASDANGCTSAASNSVTVNQPAALAVNASSGSPFTTGQSINLMSLGSGGTPPFRSYAWSGPNAYTSPVENPVITNATPLMSGAYVVTLTDENFCTATATANVLVTAAGVNTWLGITSDWFTASNWSANAIPSACTDTVIIPVGRSNYPVLTANASAGSITLQDLTSINQQNYSLSICGYLAGPAGNGLQASILGTGTTVINGTAPQSISGNLNVVELVINNSSGASLASSAHIAVANALDLKAGNLDVSSGSLTLLSTSVTQVAIIDNFSSGYNGTLTGSINSQRYYAASNTYNQHFLGSPVNNAPLSQFGATGGTSGYVVPQADCDESQLSAHSPYGALFSYHESNGAVCGVAQWKVENSGNATNGQGYSFLNPGSGTLSLTGAANLNSSYSLNNLANSNWSNVSLQGRAMSSGWQLVSNPYQATLQINSSNPGFDNQIQVWHDNGSFSGTYQVGNVGSDAIVAPFQAFMVHVTNPGSGNSYTINASDRVRTPAQFYAQHDNELDIIAQNNQTNLLDQTMIAFDTRATDNFDPQFDADKMGGALNRHTLYSLNNNKWMARNVLHSIATTPTVAIGFEPGATGTYTFTFNNVNTFDATSYIVLEDLHLNMMHDVRSGNYTFSADSADEWNRFVLHFTPAAVISTAGATCTSAGSVSVNQPGPATWNYVITDASQSLIASGVLSQSSPLNMALQAGTYTLMLTDNNNYSVSKSIVIDGAQDVVAAFSASSNNVSAQAEVQFTSTSANANAVSWNFGDGATATANAATHAYASPGNYTVTLTVTNAAGCSATTSQVIHVTGNTTAVNGVAGTGALSMWSNENRIYVDFTQLNAVNATVKIYDILGRELSNDKFTSATLYQKEINNMEAAYVIVSVINEGSVETKKLFITNTK